MLLFCFDFGCLLFFNSRHVLFVCFSFVLPCAFCKIEFRFVLFVCTFLRCYFCVVFCLFLCVVMCIFVCCMHFCAAARTLGLGVVVRVDNVLWFNNTALRLVLQRDVPRSLYVPHFPCNTGSCRLFPFFLLYYIRHGSGIPMNGKTTGLFRAYIAA